MPAAPTDESADGTRSVLEEFGYAIPAGIAIVLQGGFAIGFISGLVAHARMPDPLAYDLAFLIGGLVVSTAGTVLSVVLWMRRSWLVLACPIVTLPIGVVLGAAWGAANWGG